MHGGRVLVGTRTITGQGIARPTSRPQSRRTTEAPVDQTLSIVLPVFNSQPELAERVGKLLEFLPDLTPRFELVIVDDGSSDQTDDVAAELAREYPQIRTVRHSRRRGIEAAIQTGLARSQGEVVFVQDPAAPVSPGDLRRLWAQRNAKRPAPAMTPASPLGIVPEQLMRRLFSWGKAVVQAETPVAENASDSATSLAASGAASGGVRMIDRERVAELRRSQTRPAEGVKGRSERVVPISAPRGAGFIAGANILPHVEVLAEMLPTEMETLAAAYLPPKTTQTAAE